MGKNMESSPTPSFKNVVQIFVLIAILSRADSVKIPGGTRITKAQQIPQYRFHYYLQDNKDEDNKPHVEYKTEENSHNSFGKANSYDDVKIVSYRTEKSNGLQSDGNIGASPYHISLNSPQHDSQQNYTIKELIASSEASPIVVEPIKYVQDQKSSKSVEGDSRNEFQPADNVTNVSHLMEQGNTNQTEDRNDDIKDEQATDQIVIQDEDTAEKQTEFTIPFKKPNPVNADDFKYINDEALKQSIVNKVLQNINGNHDQFESQLNFKSTLSDKPLKIVSVDSMETERQENYQSSHEHSNFKNQHLSNKPLRLYGYNPSVVGSLYDMQVHNNRPSQIQQPPNSFNQGYSTEFGAHSDDVKSQSQPQLQLQSYDSSGMYFSQPISTIQTGSNKGNQKYNAPTSAQPLFYYDPTSMSMLPIYTNMVPNTYSIAENKPSFAPQADSNKNGFNLLHILGGGSFYKGQEQSEIPQQTALKDSIVKQESNKLEKAKPLEKGKPFETTQEKIKLQQPVMFYMNPGETPIDLKSFTMSQQPQADCNGQTHKAPALKVNKPLQPIPLCSDCKTTLALLGLPSTQLATIQQKKSVVSPQVIPMWNGQNGSKLNYLIFPNPISK